jgi:glycosyltransferase involved in cell wall biosynthesis
MSSEITQAMPRHLLYATSARIGGSGLDSVAFESLVGAYRHGCLGRAIAYANHQYEIPVNFIITLRWHPVRLLSSLRRPYYYGAKKHYLDWIAARELRAGHFDIFHGWSGESLRTLRVAQAMGVASVLEIPTWHRHKGKEVPQKTRDEIELENAPRAQQILNRLLISRQQVLEEYHLADLILVLSDKAAETFIVEGFPRSKLYKLERGVDIDRFSPGQFPEKFRAIFVGALIKRKGVHLLLEAWQQLNLQNAELVLAGTVHDEIRPYLQRHATPSVTVLGFTRNTEEHYRRSSVHILPSSCEGSAKTTYEAAACGLPQITTRESGDAVIDGVNGFIIPPDDVVAISHAIKRLYEAPELIRSMGVAGRERMVKNYTWDHFRKRLLRAYEQAMRLARERLVNQ